MDWKKHFFRYCQ